MISATLLDAVRFVWRTLEPIGAPMALVGGLALSAWDRIRATRDVDILLAIAPADVPAMLERLTAAGLRLKQSQPISLGPIELIQALYQPAGAMFEIRIDLLIASGGFHVQALSRSLPLQIPGWDEHIRVVSCEDLILLKLLAGRVIDRVDVGELLRANAAHLDKIYLLRWANELQVEPALREAWNDVFPAQPL
ncbi:MAG: nucleotidyl transferase AbiEii/AbiGii toxin family protein [Phycisphaeraceae bacterium]